MDDTPSSSNLSKLAIDAALELRWTDALKLNEQIITVDPENIDALNRQARAHFEMGDCENAKKYYTLTLQFDPYNQIAQKNLKIIQSLKSGNINPAKYLNGGGKISPASFLQEPGKTKIVTLSKVAEPQKLSQVFCGMAVELTIKNRGIVILDGGGTYLGALPDDTAHNLLRLMKGGNKYQAIVKSIKINGMSVMIRETFRSSKFRNQPSFLEAPTHALSEYIPNIDIDQMDNEPGSEEEEEQN